MSVVYLVGGLAVFVLFGWFLSFVDRLMRSGS